MKIKNLSLLVLLCSVFILFSCKKDITTNNTPPANEHPFPIPAASPVTGRITGIVVNENNVPVQNADVSFNGTTYQTDAKGLFHINNVVMDKYITTVTVNKTGYFKALRSFSATASRNYLSIKLIPKTLTGTVDASAGGAVNLSNGTTVNFQSNGIIVKSSGAAYTGTVNVYASYIDPTASDFATKVPGSMMGMDNANMYALQSTGMIAVDLESNSGQPLQLATAIKLPIPASLTGKAPQTIDTWSLDDRGIWVKEGTAVRNGGFYEMQVSHFSFWNCDVPANAIYLTIHLHDQNNQPLSNTVVQLTIPNNNTWWATTYGFTDSTGTVSGLVPADQALEMNAFVNVYSCFTPVTTQNIGPFSADTTINITATISASQYITISGTLNDCNNQPVQSGTASLLIGNYNYYSAPVMNGAYSISVPYCSSSSTATVWLLDSTSGAFAGPVNVSISGNTVNVPTQVACGVSQTALFTLYSCGIAGSYTAGIPLTSANVMSIVVNVQVPGAYTISSAPANGIQFSASGNFTHVGLDTVILTGSGTPANIGTYTITTTSAAGQACPSLLYVGPNVQPAVFTLGGSGGCPNLTIAGNYVVNYPLYQTNFVTLTVNVTSPGSYYISTGAPINGMNFSDSGVFTSTGQLTVALVGHGTPAAPTTSTFTTQADSVSGCTFDIIATNTGSAEYTFDGAPGTCTAATIAGSYQVGIPLLGPNTIAFQVNVTSAGAYSIMTNTVNGFHFTGSGAFQTLGVHTVVLTASGTPVTAGTYTYSPAGGSNPGCNFTVSVN
jgi:hypothetical protein